ncbi:MAG: hypothetical protein IJX90_12980 [Blautia sp.]|nr:hypothetical protein [Blautia sp.]
MMTGKELKEYFKTHLVPSRLYKIGGKHNNRICLQQTEDGWELFFSERKDKVGLMRFETEEAACATMKNEIRKMMEILYGMTWAPEV